ncbi:MAG: PfkB family carbohydrate kinase, partial [Pseudomonadota bacterium]
MTTGGPVACVGIAVMDLVFDVETLPHEPIKHFASDYREVGGGPAATGAVTVARIGGEAHLWARVGDDGWGQRILNDLQADGVRTEAVRQITNGKSSISAVMVDRRGERMIVNFGGQGLDHDPSWLPIDGISQFGAVLGDLRWLQGTQRALKAARQAGVPGVL